MHTICHLFQQCRPFLLHFPFTCQCFLSSVSPSLCRLYGSHIYLAVERMLKKRSIEYWVLLCLLFSDRVPRKNPIECVRPLFLVDCKKSVRDELLLIFCLFPFGSLSFSHLSSLHTHTQSAHILFDERIPILCWELLSLGIRTIGKQTLTVAMQTMEVAAAEKNRQQN